MKQGYKVLKITLIIMIACVALGMVGVVALVINGNINVENNGWFAEGKIFHTEVKETKIDGSEINNLSVNYKKGPYDVIIKTTDEKDIRIKEVIREGETFATMEQGADGTLQITSVSMKPKIFDVWVGNIYTEIFLPKDFSGELDIETASADITVKGDLILTKKADISASSGEIYIENLSAEEIKLSANSGDVTLTDSKSSGKTHISTTSGEIYAKNIVSNEINISASSGDVTLDDSEGTLGISTTSGEINIQKYSGDAAIMASSGNVTLNDGKGDFDIETTSGEVYVSTRKGSGEITTSSGDITAKIEEMDGNIKVTATSGEVYLRLPSTPGFSLLANATSGEIRTFFDDRMKYNKKGNEAEGTVGANSKLQVDITTSSGDISVDEY